MVKIKYVVIGFISVIIGVIIGLFVKPIPVATVKVFNSSNGNLKCVYIRVDSTTYFIDEIEKSKSKSVKLFVAGEAGYEIKVMFANGDSLVSGNYIETSDKITETVSDTSIVPIFIHY